MKLVPFAALAGMACWLSLGLTPCTGFSVKSLPCHLPSSVESQKQAVDPDSTAGQLPQEFLKVFKSTDDALLRSFSAGVCLCLPDQNHAGRSGLPA